MKFKTHSSLTVDQWRKEVTTSIPGTATILLTDAAIMAARLTKKQSKLIPTIGGFAAMAAVNAAGVGLIALDGPAPVLDIFGMALLAIPEPVVFAWGYDLFD